MITPYLKGFNYTWRGLSMLRKKGIRRYVLIPLTINITLFTGLIYLLVQQFSALIDRLLPDWLDWLSWLLWPLLAIAIAIAVFYSFTIIANLISAPFNSLLAAKVEKMLSGHEPQGSNIPLPATISRTITAELRKLAYMVKWLIPLLIITIIPGLNVIAGPLWILFGAWMLALEYMDYPMGNYDLFFPQIRQRAHKNRPLALGFGSGVMLMTSIPVLNFLAMPTAVIAATLMWVNELRGES